MIYPNKFRSIERLDRCLQAGGFAALGMSLLFLFQCVYDTIKHDRFSKTPADLIRIVQLTERNINAVQPSEKPSARADAFTSVISLPLSAEPYETGYFCRPLWEYRLRARPDLYPAQSLRASAGFDAFSMNAGDRKSRGYRYVVVTGILDYRQQVRAFDAAFRGAAYHRQDLDSPVYQEFRVERAEIVDGYDGRELEWRPRPVESMYYTKDHWSHVSEDPVDAKYFPPTRGKIGLVFPLGPLVNRDWGDEAGHPGIASYEADMRIVEEARRTQPVAADADSFDRDARRASSPDRQAGNPSATRAENPGGAAQRAEILFVRYIDYDVEPNKKYLYRIKLVLENPNYKVPAKYLESADLSRSGVLETAWSEPTPTVSVAPATTVALTAVNALRGFAQVSLIHFDLKTGDFQTGEFKVERGQIMNFPNQEFYPAVEAPLPKNDDLLQPHPSRRITPAAEIVDYVTDLVLVDSREGRRLPGRRQAVEPASVLVMDAEGNLAVIEEDLHPARTRSMMPAKQIAGVPK
jgi:hypothetical protein